MNAILEHVRDSAGYIVETRVRWLAPLGGNEVDDFERSIEHAAEYPATQTRVDELEQAQHENRQLASKVSWLEDAFDDFDKACQHYEHVIEVMTEERVKKDAQIASDLGNARSRRKHAQEGR